MVRNCKIYEPFVTCNSIAQDLSIIQKSIRQYFFICFASLCRWFAFVAEKFRWFQISISPIVRWLSKWLLARRESCWNLWSATQPSRAMQEKKAHNFSASIRFFSSSAPAQFCAQKFNCVRCERSSVLAFSEWMGCTVTLVGMHLRPRPT